VEIYKRQLQGRRVLLVDDNDLNRRTISEMLFSWQMQPFVCSSGSDALIYINNKYSFDLALIDIRMPGMDGYELARKMIERGASFPLIALSSIGQDIKKGLFHSFLSKPISEEKLLMKILDILGIVDSGKTIEIGITDSESDSGKKERLLARRQEQSPVYRKQYQTNPCGILLAEDIVINQKVMTEMLQSLGYTNVTIVNDGQEVIDIVNANPHKFKVVLLDLKMPRKTGFEVAEYLRDKYGDRCPILIAVTAVALKEGQKCGLLDAYLTKPIEYSQLETVLKGLL
jgi:two-component system, sensor histidine kinase and response regulator